MKRRGKTLNFVKMIEKVQENLDEKIQLNPNRGRPKVNISFVHCLCIFHQAILSTKYGGVS